jgi:hypothetical protein
MITVRLLHMNGLDMVGFIPSFLDEDDPRPAREQLDAHYGHGGGWRPMQGWDYNFHNRTLRYPGDPEMGPIAEMWLRKEMILVYPHAWVAIVQPDGVSVEIARMD